MIETDRLILRAFRDADRAPFAAIWLYSAPVRSTGCPIAPGSPLSSAT